MRTDYIKICNAYLKGQNQDVIIWNETDIWDYIHKFNTLVYNKGYTRTGCMF